MAVTSADLVALAKGNIAERYLNELKNTAEYYFPSASDLCKAVERYLAALLASNNAKPVTWALSGESITAAAIAAAGIETTPEMKAEIEKTSARYADAHYLTALKILHDAGTIHERVQALFAVVGLNAPTD